MKHEAQMPAEIARLQQEWRDRGRMVRLGEGHRIFAVQEGDGPDLVLVHGFPSTSHDYAAAMERLTGRFRVTTWDQLGFGFSDKPASDTCYSLFDQARRGAEVVRALGVERARVVGHDMGLTVAVEMLCRHEAGDLDFAMQGITLCNGSHLVELAQITPLQYQIMTDDGAEEFARDYDPERFAAGFRFLWGDPTRTADADIRAIAYWLPLGGGLDILSRIARYNLERSWYAERWRSVLRRRPVPIEVVWGDRDPIAVIEIGHKLSEMSAAPLSVLTGVGHYPQMEAPVEWVEAVTQRW
jgi:pimeloyl-ACP methyl ester carboxylesterase